MLADAGSQLQLNVPVSAAARRRDLGRVRYDSRIEYDPGSTILWTSLWAAGVARIHFDPGLGPSRTELQRASRQQQAAQTVRSLGGHVSTIPSQPVGIMSGWLHLLMRGTLLRKCVLDFLAKHFDGAGSRSSACIPGLDFVSNRRPLGYGPQSEQASWTQGVRVAESTEYRGASTRVWMC